MRQLMVIVLNIGRSKTRQRAAFRTLAACVAFVTVVPALQAAIPERTAVLESLPQLWRDELGNSFNLGDLSGHPVVLTMAYASCHRICPMTIQRLQQLQEGFDVQRIPTEFIIVGYDPEADDATAWRLYRRIRHLTRPNWHFLIGSPQQVALFARTLGFEFWKADDHVMHDARIIYLDTQGVSQLDRGVGPQQASTTK